MDDGGPRSSGASISTIRRRVRPSSSSRLGDGGLASSCQASRLSCITRSSCGCAIVPELCGTEELHADATALRVPARVPATQHGPSYTTRKASRRPSAPSAAGPGLWALFSVRRAPERADARGRDPDQAAGGAEEGVARPAPRWIGVRVVSSDRSPACSPSSQMKVRTIHPEGARSATESRLRIRWAPRLDEPAEQAFSCDIAYSRSPTASRASVWSRYT